MASLTLSEKKPMEATSTRSDRKCADSSRHTKCPLCDGVLQADDDFSRTSHFIDSPAIRSVAFPMRAAELTKAVTRHFLNEHPTSRLSECNSMSAKLPRCFRISIEFQTIHVARRVRQYVAEWRLAALVIVKRAVMEIASPRILPRNNFAGGPLARAALAGALKWVTVAAPLAQRSTNRETGSSKR